MAPINKFFKMKNQLWKFYTGTCLFGMQWIVPSMSTDSSFSVRSYLRFGMNRKTIWTARRWTPFLLTKTLNFLVPQRTKYELQKQFNEHKTDTINNDFDVREINLWYSLRSTATCLYINRTVVQVKKRDLRKSWWRFRRSLKLG